MEFMTSSVPELSGSRCPGMRIICLALFLALALDPSAAVWADTKSKASQSVKAHPRKPEKVNWSREFVFIESFSPPAGWGIEPKDHALTPGLVSRLIHPPHCLKTATLAIHLWSRPVRPPSEHELRSRRKIYDTGPHNLNAEEIESLSSMLQQYSRQPERHELTAARSLDWNGKSGIYIEAADFADRNGARTVDDRVMILYVDPKCDGSALVELCFSANPEIFAKYKNVALRAFKSIRWVKSAKANCGANER